MSKGLLVFACISMALAVCFGALGAHALKGVLSEASLHSFDTGVRYQIIHSLAIILLVILGTKVGNTFNRPIRLMAIGMMMFSFSIYVLSTRALSGWEGIGSYIGWITPVGGLLLIASWIWVAIILMRRGKVA